MTATLPPTAPAPPWRAPWRAAAAGLLEAARARDPRRLAAELDRAATVAGLCDGGAPDDAERGELLQALVEDMRRAQARARRLPGAPPAPIRVWEDLLAHLAGT